MEEFHYKVPWRSRSAHAGFHASVHTGGGYDFRGHAPLMQGRDPRRIDLRASARDPTVQLQVRIYRQKTAVPVYALADLSASMQFGDKRTMLVGFVAALAYSAHRTGDAFSFIGCDAAFRPDIHQPPTRVRAAGQRMSEKLRHLKNWGNSSAGLAEAIRYIDQGRSLVFLVSDFYFSSTLLASIFDTLATHTVVPIVIRDSAETRAWPFFGMVRLRDSETAQWRPVLIRPSLTRRLAQEAEKRDRALRSLCVAHAMPPLFVVDRFRADDVTDYFLKVV